MSSKSFTRANFRGNYRRAGRPSAQVKPARVLHRRANARTIFYALVEVMKDFCRANPEKEEEVFTDELVMRVEEKINLKHQAAGSTAIKKVLRKLNDCAEVIWFSYPMVDKTGRRIRTYYKYSILITRRFFKMKAGELLDKYFFSHYTVASEDLAAA